ncbi:MAG: OmpA family protein [Sulfurimonas sp.]|jgi:outer membrane protein OmpA-like peptidoglycan-associated protein|nr:OmpA family protein [Sulfurimonas sp.]
MKKITLSLLFLPLLLQANTSDFSLVLNKEYPSSLHSVTQNYDRTISAIGISKYFNKNDTQGSQTFTDPFEYLRHTSNRYGSNIHLITIDNKANIIQDKAYKLPKFNEALSLLKTPTNGYMVGGTTQDGSLLLMKLSANAQLEFSKEFGTKNNDSLSKLISLKDGGVLAIGTSATTRNAHQGMFQSGLGLNDIYLTRFSKNGTLVWSKKYGTSQDDYGIDAIEARDGSIILVGVTHNNGQKKTLLSRVNETGDKIWLHEFEAKESLVPHKLLKLRNNTFVLVANKEDMQGKKQIQFIHFDQNYTILANKTFSTTYSSTLFDIKELSNSNIVGVGNVQDKENTDGLFVHLDKNFNLICQEHFGNEAYDTFDALSVLHNSNIIATGSATNPTSQEANMWITKITPDCSLAQKAVDSEQIYSALEKEFYEELREENITLTQNLTLELHKQNLYFKVGEYELTQEQQKFLDRFSKRFLALLHKYKDQIQTLEINGHTSSEWGDVDFTQRYLKNEKLSMNRSFATLSYLFVTQGKEIQDWLTQILKGSGLSYAKKVSFQEKEHRELSRRVSFKIILKDQE